MNRDLVEVLLGIAPGFLAALFYGFVSGSMSFINKTVLTSYHYHFPDVVMFSQIICTSVILEICRITKLTDIPPWTVKRWKEFAIPSFCFALHTTLALAALDDLSIPIYNVLRRMLPLSSLIVSMIVLQKYPSKGTISAVSLIVVGTLVTGFGDLSFHLSGYSHAILSVVAQSIYLTYVQKTGLEKGSSALSVLHLNSINCIPLLFLYTYFNGNLVKGVMFTGFKDTTFLTYFVMNILFGCVLNYSLFLCATMNSALTTSFVGVIKGVITTIIGFFTFGGVAATFLTVGGVTLNALGGVLYTYIKFREKKQEIDRLLPTFISPTTSSKSSSDLSSSMNGVLHARHRHESTSEHTMNGEPHTTIQL